jgi:hypothetical protein
VSIHSRRYKPFAYLPVAAQENGLGVRVKQRFHGFLGVRRLQELVQLDRVALVRLLVRLAPMVVKRRHKCERPEEPCNEALGFLEYSKGASMPDFLFLHDPSRTHY